MKRILVIGASGLLGAHLMERARALALPAMGTCHGHPRPSLLPFDLTRDALARLVTDLGERDVVYILAAQIDPEACLDRPEESWALNVEGPRRVAEECLAREAKVVFMSSAWVFEGGRGGYGEEDTAQPTTRYGMHKKAVEDWLEKQGGRWCIARTGAIVGSRPTDHCPVLRTYKSLLEPGARMARDNRFSIIAAEDLAEGLLKLAEPESSGIYHLVAHPPVSRASLAALIRSCSRYAEGMAYKEIPFSDLAYREPRPLQPWLLDHRAFQTWGYSPSPPDLVVPRKVALIDAWRDGGGTWA